MIHLAHTHSSYWFTSFLSFSLLPSHSHHALIRTFILFIYLHVTLHLPVVKTANKPKCEMCSLCMVICKVHRFNEHFEEEHSTSPQNQDMWYCNFHNTQISTLQSMETTVFWKTNVRNDRIFPRECSVRNNICFISNYNRKTKHSTVTLQTNLTTITL